MTGGEFSTRPVGQNLRPHAAQFLRRPRLGAFLEQVPDAGAACDFSGQSEARLQPGTAPGSRVNRSEPDRSTTASLRLRASLKIPVWSPAFRRNSEQNSTRLKVTFQTGSKPNPCSEGRGAHASGVWFAASRRKLFTHGCPPPNRGEICENEAGGATPSAARGTHALPIFNYIVPAKRVVTPDAPSAGLEASALRQAGCPAPRRGGQVVPALPIKENSN